MQYHFILLVFLISVSTTVTIYTKPQPVIPEKINADLPVEKNKPDLNGDKTKPTEDNDKLPKKNGTQPKKCCPWCCTITNCTDLAADCAQYVNTRCKKNEYAVLMYKQCKNTCGMCNMIEEPCVDKNRNCLNWNRRGYCSSNYYSNDEKKENCALTCNLCSKATDKCRDVNKNCANWDLKGFCANIDYNEVIKKANCAKTCKLC